jgi:GAF domain-containing protein
MIIEDENGGLKTADLTTLGHARSHRSRSNDLIYQLLLIQQPGWNEHDVIEHATQIIGAVLQADCYGIMLLDPSRAALYCHPSARSGCGHVDMLPLTTKSIVTKVFNAGRSIRISNARLDPNYYPIDREVRSELCVPLKTSTGKLGVINVESTCPDAFTLEDEHWLMNIAAHLAAAIERARF